MSLKLLSAVAALAVLAAAPAEARFGKRSTPEESGKPKKPKKAPRSAEPGDSHAATPVRRYRPGPRYVYAPPVHRARPRLYSWHFHHPPHLYVAPAPVVEARPEPATQESSVRFTAAGEVHAFSAGASLGAGFLLEGERLGLSLNAAHLVVAADDGQGGVDRLQQLNAHLTYALLSGDRGRLRLEGGLDTVFAPDIITLGPTGGLSAVLWVAGPLALEGSAMVTPFPHRQLDLRAGVGLGFGPLGVRAGWRTLVLDDAGIVDGVSHVDVFNGPYLGVALAL